MAQTNTETLKYQCMHLPEVCKEQLEGIRDGLERVDWEAFKRIRKFYLTGCGDSLDACIACLPTFKKYAEAFAVRYEILRPMEAARYFVFDELDKQVSVMCAISASGGPNRIREILERAGSNGFYTLTITNRAESPAAQVADFPIIVKSPGIVDRGPGMINYFASLAALMSLAAFYGAYRGFAPAGALGELHEKIETLAQQYDARLAQVARLTAALADEFSAAEAYEFVADGAEYASAYFSAEKMIETCGVFAAACDSAEFLSARILENARDIPTFFFADKQDPGTKGTLRALAAACDAGRPAVLVCNGAADEFGVDARRVRVLSLPAPERDFRFLNPLFDCVAGALFASDAAQRRNSEYFGGYYQGNLFRTYNSIPVSEIKVV